VQRKKENLLHKESTGAHKHNGECRALAHLRKRHAELLRHIVRKCEGVGDIYRQSEEAEVLDLGQRLFGLLCHALRGDSKVFGQGACRLVSEYGGLVLSSLNAIENAVVEIFGRQRRIARLLLKHIEVARKEVQKRIESGR